MTIKIVDLDGQSPRTCKMAISDIVLGVLSLAATEPDPHHKDTTIAVLEDAVPVGLWPAMDALQTRALVDSRRRRELE